MRVHIPQEQLEILCRVGGVGGIEDVRGEYRARETISVNLSLELQPSGAQQEAR